MEISPEQSERLKKLTKYVILPLVGAAAVRPVVRTIRDSTIYADVYESGSYKYGVIKDKVKKFIETSGFLGPDGEPEPDDRDLTPEEIDELVTTFEKVVQEPLDSE